MRIADMLQNVFQKEGVVFLKDLYKELLHREPDAGGLAYHIRLLQSKTAKAHIFMSMLHSGEAQSLYQQSSSFNAAAGRLTVAQKLQLLFPLDYTKFVQGLFTELLGREGSQGELELYVYMLKRGASRLSLFCMIFLSKECRALLETPGHGRDVINTKYHVSQEREIRQNSSQARPLSKKVSIIILAWNGLAFTKRCLESLKRTSENKLVDVIVFDNGSTDGTVQYLQSIDWIKTIANGENIGFPAGNNKAIQLCEPDSDIILLNNDVFIKQDEWVHLLQETAYSEPSIGIVGCRLCFEDRRFQHAGSFIYPETLSGQLIGGNEVDINQYSGIRDVQGVIFACAYIKREVFDKVGYLDPDYFAYFEDTDYCLKAIAAGYRVVVDGRVTSIHLQHTSTKENKMDFSQLYESSRQVFRKKWEPYLRSQYDHHVNWHSVANLPTGYANSSRNLMIALDDLKVRVHYRYVYGPGTPVPIQEPAMSDDYRINVFSSRHHDPASPEVVYGQGDVFHKNKGRYKIGYTMLEVDGLPKEWVRQCNLMDEVWVPSRFNLETFRGSGVRAPIHVVPLGIDPNYFNPDIRGGRFSDKFTFLTVFEWGERKGPEALLQTFAKEFAHDKDVLLVCKINNNDPSIDVPSEIRKLNLNIGSKILVLHNQIIANYLLGSLYRSADCFVLSSRGEGWGMPILEALACGIPTIATDWSAQRDFLNGETGYPIRVKKLIPAVARCPYYADFRWAEPDYEHMAYLMRYVYENRDTAKQRSREIAKNILSKWNWSNAAAKIKERLRIIESSR